MNLKIKPLVSVVLTTYKRPQKLKHALLTVMNQSYPSIELIVVDDNNPNSHERIESEKIVTSFQKNYPFIYIKHSKNMGGSCARNSGAKKAKGDYVAFYDDDDEWFNNKIESQINYFQNLDEDVGAIYCSYIFVSSLGDIEIIRSEKGRLTKEVLCQEFDPGASSTLVFRKKVLEEIGYFNEKFERHQDLEILIRLFKKYSIDVDPEILLKINGHNPVHSKKLISVKKVFFESFEAEINNLSFVDKKKFYAIHTLQVAYQYRSEKNYSKFFKYVLRSFFTFPFMKQYFIILLNTLSYPFKR